MYRAFAFNTVVAGALIVFSSLKNLIPQLHKASVWSLPSEAKFDYGCCYFLSQKHRNFPCRSPSEFCIFHEWFLFRVFSSTSPPCSDVEVFRVFSMPGIQIYLRIFRFQTFECPTSANISCFGGIKNGTLQRMVPPFRVPVKQTFFLPANMRQAQQTCKSCHTKEKPQISGASLNGSIRFMC